MAGYNTGKAPARDWLRSVGFAAVTAIVIYVILDIEYPRLGLIRLDVFDQALSDLRATMGP